MRNPFQLVYDSLFNLVVADPQVRAMVLPGNAISYQQLHGQPPEKEQLNPADLPQVILISSGAGFNLHATSNSTQCTRRYTWLVAVAGFQLQTLAAIEWGMLCAMASWRTKLTPLTWPEGMTQPHNHFVKGLEASDINEALLPAPQAKGVAGWHAIWACQVEMYFRTRDLQGYLAGDDLTLNP